MEEQQYKLLDGKAVSAQVKQEMAEEVARIKATGGKIPHLAAILVGHDGGSETYVASKVKTCNEIGFKSSLIRYEADVTEEELLRKVDELNNDPDVDGFIVQLPLPKHISEQKIIEAIDYRSGDKVRVTGGPFKGAEGYIKRIRGNRRLVVALEGIIAVATTYIPGRFLEKMPEN
jgi:transcription antitermination factor NusG